jgi:hypothetical protein
LQVFHNEVVDRDKLQIDDKLDEEGRLEVATEEQIYMVLGLKKQDESETDKRE